MNRNTEQNDNFLRAVQATARLAGLKVKKVTTADDLDDQTLTIVLTGPSAGWVQEVLAFDREHSELNDVETIDEKPKPLEVVADAAGHVEQVLNGQAAVDPSDLTEKDETVEADYRDLTGGDETAELPSSS